MKVDTVTYEIEHCGGCPHVLDWFDTGKQGERCGKGKRRKLVPDAWGEIPKWCPLETKKEEKDGRDKG